jgi:prevent-host-death family protein
MAEKPADVPPPVRIIGSRELHQSLPAILRELEGDAVRYVLTVHGKPRAVLIGAEPYLKLAADRRTASETIVALQLSALLGLGSSPEGIDLDGFERAIDGETS